MGSLSLRGGLLTAALAVFAACGRGKLDPVAVPVDRVGCARCGMLVSDLRAAAEAVYADEDPRFYDDVGCLAADREAAGGRSELYVETGRGWVRAGEALYARPEAARTPMGYGFVAFADRREAESRDSEGRARSWDEVVRHIRTQGGRHHAAS